MILELGNKTGFEKNRLLNSNSQWQELFLRGNTGTDFSAGPAAIGQGATVLN